MTPNPAPVPAAMPNADAARNSLNVPSILLILGGVLGVLYGIMQLFARSTGMALMKMIPNADPAMRDQLEHQLSAGSQLGNVIGGMLFIGLSAFAIFGALKMRNLQGYGLAMAAAIVSIIPCTGCCCVNIPVGIWALVVLMKPEVKASFTA